MNFRRIRLIYQITFFLLFCFLIYAASQKFVEYFPVELFLNFSLLSGLATIISQHNLASEMILGVLIAAGTLFLGRFFCGWICPMGIVQHFASKIFTPAEKKEQYKKNTYCNSHRIKYIILLIFVFCSFFGVILSGYFDPISLITRFSVTVIYPLIDKSAAFQTAIITAAIFIAVFLLNIYKPRFWCRTICPLGALLSLFSVKPLFRMVRDDEKCIHCGLCHQNCQGGCEIDKELIPSDCLMCMNCVDVCPVRAIEFKVQTKKESSRQKPLKGIDLSRRDFIISGVTAIGAVGILNNLRKITGRGFDKRIRPPGALEENDFLSKCIRCGQCMKVCPTNVIQPAYAETDIAGLWTPILKMQYGYCEYDCNLCSTVCPSGAIREITVEQKHDDGYDRIGTAFVNRGRCLPWAFGKECLVCQEVCPVSPKAIYFQEGQFEFPDGRTVRMKMPYVDPELCIGCGVCEYNCPVRDLPAITISSIGERRNPDRKLIL